MADDFEQEGMQSEVVVGGPVGAVLLPRPLLVSIPQPVLDQAPTSVTVYVTGVPLGDVSIAIDGQVVHTGTNVSLGVYGPVSLPVAKVPPANTDYYDAGEHTVTATAGSDTLEGTATFVLTLPPPSSGWMISPDAHPVAVPAAVTSSGVHRWVFQDLMPGGLGSYVLELNPKAAGPWPMQRTLQTSTTVRGQVNVSESAAMPQPFQFTGTVFSQAMHDQMLEYAGLRRRWYLIDHRNRAWIFTFTGIDFVAKKRRENTRAADWEHDYSASGVLYPTGDEPYLDWRVPA